MKKIISRSIILICIVFFSSSNILLSAENAIDEVSEIINSFNNVNQSFMNEGQHEDSTGNVIVIGPSGSGKSTVITCLAGRPLFIKEGYSGLQIDTTEPLDGFTIGHNLMNVGTTSPSKFYDSTNKITFYDLPGFYDTRGSKEDVINAYYFFKLSKSNVNTKFVLVMPESSFTSYRSGLFLGTLQTLSNCFENLDDLKKSLSLVVTKQRDVIPSIIVTKMLLEENEFFNEYIKNPRVKEILKFLSNSSESRISCLPYPHKKSYSDEIDVIYNPSHKNKILDNILVSEYIRNPKVKYYIDDKSMILLHKASDNINKLLVEHIKKEINQQIISFCVAIIQDHQYSQDINILRNFFASLKNDLVSLKTTLEKPHLAFEKKLNSFIDTKILKGLIEKIKFMKKLNNSIKYQTDTWFSALFDTLEQINLLTLKPSSIYSEEKLQLKGILIGAQDINEAIRINKISTKPLKNIEIFSLHALIIDEDIKSLGTYENRTPSLSIISPYWKVSGSKLISLTGADGIPGMDGIKEGESGIPGYAGGNGGHFYGKMLTIENKQNLHINTDGGYGGAGGNGRDGKDGSNGEDGDLSKHETRGNTSTYNDKGKDGKRGQDGGKGGKGGLGGYQGIVNIDGISYDFIQQAPRNGKDGIPGIGGKGGIHGRDCQGTYLSGLARQEQYRQKTYGGFAHTTGTRTVYDGTTWSVTLSHKPSRGNAESGNIGIGFNEYNQQIPSSTPNIDIHNVIKNYSKYQEEQNKLPLVSPLILRFPIQ